VSASLSGNSKAVNVAVTAEDDQVGEVAAKVRTALGNDTDVSEIFTVSGEGANVILTNKAYDANDPTLAINLTDADGTGVTFGASGDTTAGASPVCQVETVTVTAAATQQGTLLVTVTADGMGNSPKGVDVSVTEEDDTAAKVAAKVRAALEADEDVAAFFTVSGEGADIVLTALTAAADDGTMAITMTDAPATGVTFGASTDTTAGVPCDTVSVGWNDKLGLPYKLSHDTVLAACLDNVRETTAPTVTVDSDDVENNTVDLDSALNGKQVDIYLAV